MHPDIDDKTPIFVAPANPAGRKLAKALQREGYCVKGFVDNLKQGADIINDVSHFPQNAKVVLHKATYTDTVATGLIQRKFPQNSLLLCDIKDITTKPDISPLPLKKEEATPSFSRYRVPFNYRLTRFWFCICALAFKLIRLVSPKRSYLYYAEGFFDTNVLLAYREHKRQFNKEPFLLGLNLKQRISELDDDETKFERLSFKVLWKICCAKRIIVDHEYTGVTFTILRKFIPVVQLWHGLPYKALSGNRHYPDVCDDIFISSSAWFNKEIFPKIFRANTYLALGYPRNDAFFQSPSERDWVNAEPFELIEKVKQESGDIIVYAPTYRDWGNNEYPLDLDTLNSWCSKTNRAFILKFHPFISRLFGEAMGLEESNALQQLPNHQHIYLYPSGKNIYPWLAEATALVTDYSSIAYDFMLADKQIIYFQYDKAEYLKLRGETLVSDDDFIAGDVVESVDEMLNCLSENMKLSLATSAVNKHIDMRQTELLAKFHMTPQVSSNLIINHVRHD